MNDNLPIDKQNIDDLPPLPQEDDDDEGTYAQHLDAIKRE